MIDVRQTIQSVINRILTDSGRRARVIADGDLLVEGVGLDSLDLAILVVTLEQDLGVDPFREGHPPVATFGEVVKVYERSLNSGK